MVLVEVSRKAYLASIVPVIVNAILNEHQIIVDIVAFVNKGDFPRSRLGEKQRGKLLAGWVTRKMSTLAQFAIRDVDAGAIGEAGAPAGDDMSHRNSTHSLSNRSFGAGAITGTSSLRNSEPPPPRIMEHEEFEQQMGRIADMAPAEGVPGGDRTPTGYAPADERPRSSWGIPQDEQPQQGQNVYGYEAGREGTPLPPLVGPKPTSPSGEADSRVAPQIRLPGVDGREGFDFWGDGGGGSGGLGDHSRNNSSRDGAAVKDEDDSWEADAIMHMNLTGDMGGPR